MNARAWTSKETAVLHRRYPRESTRALAQALGRSYESVKSRAKVLGLTKESRRPWTAAETTVMRRRYPHEPTVAIATSLGRPVDQVYSCAVRLGLAKTEVYLASPHACRLRRGDNVGAAFRFKKGQTPANKGLRRPGYSVGRGRMRETQFKKGESRNKMAIGATRLADGYVYRKVSEIPNVPWTRNWVVEHVRVWAAANGPVPPGHAIAFKNGNRTDIRLDNLACVTKASVMDRNTIHNLPPELKQTVQLLGRVNRQIRKRTRDGQKQDHRSA